MKLLLVILLLPFSLQAEIFNPAKMNSVTVTAGMAGISVTAVINAPTTGQTVHVSNTVATTCATCATSANQTTQITAEQAIHGAVTHAAGLAINISQVAGSNISFSTPSVVGKIPVALFAGDGQIIKSGRPTDTPLTATNQSLEAWSALTGVSPTGTTQLPVGTQIDSEGTTRIAIAGPEYHTRSTTYAIAAAAVTPVASATDIFTITGSATKTIVVKRITVSGAATVQGSYTLTLLKRSTANSGGTSEAKTAVPLDSIDAAGTATYLAYSANPTTGTLIGTLQTVIQPLGVVAGGATTNAPLILDFSIGNIKAIYLRGTGQVLALSGQGITAPAGTILNINAIVEEY